MSLFHAKVQAPIKPVAAPRQYYPALDGFRALAILLVFFHHYITYFPGMDSRLAASGWIGVDLFFVLSGFLITGILWDSKGKPHALHDFYIRRGLRIWPLYYGVLLVLFVLSLAAHWKLSWYYLLWVFHLGNYAHFLTDFPVDFLTKAGNGYDTSLVSFGHFWSLCVEEQFYLLWPLVVMSFRSKKRLLQLCVAVLLFCPVLRYVLSTHVNAALLSKELCYRILPTRMDALLYGGALAVLMRSRAQHWIAERKNLLSVACILPFVVLSLYRWHRHFNYSSTGTAGWVTVAYSALDLAALGLILQLISNDSKMASLFSLSWLRRLGVISYGFYVFHDLPHGFYQRMAFAMAPSHPLVTLLLLAFTCTLAISVLSYRFYETPFLRLKARFSHQAHHAPQLVPEGVEEGHREKESSAA